MDASRVCVLDTNLISVWVYPARRMIHHQMKAFCFGADFRAALTRGAEAMEQHGATKWLSDDRLNSALPPDDEQWGYEVWFPRARAAGWRHWAIVQPAKLLGRSSIGRISKQYVDAGVNMRMFGDPDEAMRWLDAQ
jgi:hypothetical protein